MTEILIQSIGTGP